MRTPLVSAGPAFALALGLAASAGLAGAAGEIAPGAYCPLPEPGEKAECLTPAKNTYGGFFDAVAAGRVEDDEMAQVETDLAAGASAENAYLALSSLAYGYYRMAQRAAADPEQDPIVIARLERWNQLLASAYEASPDDGRYRAAVQQAALDVHRRSPPVGLACLDENGDPARCDSTEAVLRTLGRRRDETGIRGALGRLIGRVFGEGGS